MLSNPKSFATSFILSRITKKVNRFLCFFFHFIFCIYTQEKIKCFLKRPVNRIADTLVNLSISAQPTRKPFESCRFKRLSSWVSPFFWLRRWDFSLPAAVESLLRVGRRLPPSKAFFGRIGYAKTPHRGVFACLPMTSSVGRGAMSLRGQKGTGHQRCPVPFWLRRWDLNLTVLHFHCGENATVGSAALTAHWAVIHYRLTLRVIRPRAHNPAVVQAKSISVSKNKSRSIWIGFCFWLRRWDLNLTTSGL